MNHVFSPENILNPTVVKLLRKRSQKRLAHDPAQFNPSTNTNTRFGYISSAEFEGGARRLIVCRGERTDSPTFYHTDSAEALQALPGQAVSFVRANDSKRARSFGHTKAHPIHTRTLHHETAPKSILRAPAHGRLVGRCVVRDGCFSLVTGDRRPQTYQFKLPAYNAHNHFTPQHDWTLSCKLTRVRSTDHLLTAFHIITSPPHTDNTIIPLPVVADVTQRHMHNGVPTLVVGQLSTADLPIHALLHLNGDPAHVTLDELLNIYISMSSNSVLDDDYPHSTSAVPAVLDPLFGNYRKRSLTLTSRLKDRLPVHILFSNALIPNCTWRRLMREHWKLGAKAVYRVNTYTLVGIPSHIETTAQNFYHINANTHHRISAPGPDTTNSFTVYQKATNYSTLNGTVIRPDTSPTHTADLLLTLEHHTRTFQTTHFPPVHINATTTTSTGNVGFLKDANFQP